MTGDEFATQLIPIRNGWCVRFAGALTFATYLTAEVAVEEAERRGGDGLIIDLAELTFIDSQGVRLVLSTWQRARVDARRLAIVAPAGPVARVLHVAGIADRLPLVGSLNEAFSAVGGSD